MFSEAILDKVSRAFSEKKSHYASRAFLENIPETLPNIQAAKSPENSIFHRKLLPFSTENGLIVSFCSRKAHECFSLEKKTSIFQPCGLTDSFENPATHFPRKKHPGGLFTVWLGPDIRTSADSHILGTRVSASCLKSRLWFWGLIIFAPAFDLHFHCGVPPEYF